MVLSVVSIWARRSALVLGMVMTTLAASAQRLSVAKLDHLLARDYPANQPGAAVLVAQKGHVLLRQGYGTADLRTGVRMSPDREFRVASISKQFTAVAVLQLVAQGKVRLDAPVSEYLPELFAGREWGITVRDLLAHTSGLKNYSDLDEFRNQPSRNMSTEYLWSLVKGYGVRFAPGSEWEYCNTGYMLLGALVERVSGSTFADYLDSHVLRPAGLRYTRYGAGEGVENPAARPTAAGVVGYRPVGAAYEPSVVLNLTQANAAGAIISRVDDLYRWEQAIEAGKVLDPKYVALARTEAGLRRPAAGADHSAFGDPNAKAPYGFGWELGEVAGRRTIGHGGTMSGYRSYEVEVPELDLYIAILCNCERPQSDPAAVADRIIRLALK